MKNLVWALAAPLVAIAQFAALTGVNASDENKFIGKWRAVTMDGRAVSSKLEATISFTVGGKFKGFSGCNGMHGTYTIDGSNLILGDHAITLLPCRDEVMQFETQFSRLLSQSSVWQVKGDKLLAKGQMERSLLEFIRSDVKN